MTFCSKTGYNWLLYEEGQEMFCLFCRKHNVVKAKNQSKKFKMEPAVRFKKKAVEEHANSQQHSAAFTAELLSRVSTFNEETKRKEKTRDEVYYNTFLAMYWLAKEEIANTKFGSLLELLEQVGLKDLKFFQHRSASSVREMFLLLGRGGWTRAELHHESTLQYASVYTSSHAVRTSELATEDPLKLEFLSSFRCKCLTLNVILLHNSSDYLTNTC